MFQDGMTLSQAQAENPMKTPYHDVTSGYWYTSSLMSGDMCASSCLKYGFMYAGIQAK